MKKAIFLDRDGTINPDSGYISKAEEFCLFDGVVEAVKLLNEEGYLVFVITNQSGINRGFIDEKELDIIHLKMISEFEQGGAKIHEVSYCPHRPDEMCDCRKPSPRMILELAEKSAIDLGHSYMVGDKQSDVEAGIRSGCRTVLIGSNLIEGCSPDYFAPDLFGAVDWIIKDSKADI
ncbi:MAG: HAD family hydrolase [Candidatus Theseobacter exili]|nr:HAD family hydrolase [Candidatus Theseobacter exili]